MGRKVFSIYVADAFAEQVFGGNQAGVALLGTEQDFPEESLMRKIAGEMRHSETAFVKKAGRDAFRVRFFTPVEEVALCGHATIGTFGVLYAEGLIGDGTFWLYPGAEKEGQKPLEVMVQDGNVWMNMEPPKVERKLGWNQALELYSAYGLNGEAELSRLKSQGEELLPSVVNTGLPDIMLPVGDLKSLNKAVQDREKVIGLSKRYQAVGVHMFCLASWPEIGLPGNAAAAGEPVIAHCRNFAPGVGIDEESATGTANGALTWYLHQKNLLQGRREYLFLQGEAMGKPSWVKCRLQTVGEGAEEQILVQVGGRARISLKGRIYAEE